MRDWSKEPLYIQRFVAKFGLGPLYKPTPPKRHKCPKCGGLNMVWDERHADTGMDAVLLCCPDCGFESEKPKAGGEG